jgi:hypothetical protein
MPGQPKAQDSPVSRLKTKNTDQSHEIEHLKERLAAAEARDGSLFDLRRDTVKDIVTAILAHINPSRAEDIAREILARLKAKKMPAG